MSTDVEKWEIILRKCHSLAINMRKWPIYCPNRLTAFLDEPVHSGDPEQDAI